MRKAASQGRSAGGFVLVALGLIAAPAAAYELKLDSTGSPVRWAEGLISYAIDARGGKDIPGDRMQASLEQCLGVWGQVETAAVRFVPHAAPASFFLGYDNKADAANENVILFVEKSWPFDPAAVAVTIATYRVSTHEIIDADVAFNGQNHRWALYGGAGAPAPKAYDLQNAATHELGHVIGLAHNGGEPDATMFPRAKPAETSKRTLDADDAAGLSTLYPLSERTGFMPPRGKIPVVDTSRAVDEGGCATGGGLGWLAAALGLLALWAARERRRPAPARVHRVGLLVAMLAAGAQAATFVPLTLDDLAARARMVVRVRALARTDAWSGRVIHASTTVGTLQCLKGACPASFQVRQPGGEVGDLGQIVSGSTPLDPGKEVLLFLEKDPGAPMGVWRPVGMDQGVFEMATGAFGTPVARPRGGVVLESGSAAAVFTLGDVQRAAGR